MKVNKTEFIIVRVTKAEKEYLVQSAKKARIILSKFIRSTLGLDK